MTGDLARRFYEAGGRAEWEEHGCTHTLVRCGMVWLVSCECGNYDKEVRTDHEADCLCRCKMLDDLKPHLSKLAVGGAVAICRDPEALLRAWEEVCCD